MEVVGREGVVRTRRPTCSLLPAVSKHHTSTLEHGPAHRTQSRQLRTPRGTFPIALRSSTVTRTSSSCLYLRNPKFIKVNSALDLFFRGKKKVLNARN